MSFDGDHGQHSLHVAEVVDSDGGSDDAFCHGGGMVRFVNDVPGYCFDSSYH
jgi:hypothetical protein